MIRLRRLTIRHATTPVLAFCLFLSGRSTSAQTPSVQLASISAHTSTGSPRVDFTYNTDITAYTLSTYQVTAATNGGAISSPSVLATISQQAPSVISVPLDFTSLVANQATSVSITVTLGNTASQKALTNSYSLDLSFLATVKTYQATIASLQQANQSLQSSMTQCNTNLASVSQKLNPHSLNYLSDSSLIGPTAVVLHFKTDLYATVSVTEPHMNNPISSVGTDHYVKIDQLSPSTSYTFTVAALDATTGTPIAHLGQSVPVTTAAAVTFAPILESVSAGGPTSLVATVNFDPNHQLPTNFRSYLKLYYQVQLPDHTFGPPVPFGDGALDANGFPQGTAYTGPYTAPQKVTIPVPLANTQYLVSFIAYDQYGEKVSSAAQGVPTAAVQPALAFNGPVTLSMDTNAGLTVKWNANRNIKTAELAIKLPTGVFVPNIPKPTVGSTESSITVDPNVLQPLLDTVAPPKGSHGTPTTPANSSNPPVFTISMDDGSGTPEGKVSVSFIVTFTISKTQNPTNSTQTNANKVAQAAQSNSKITWAQVFQTGLGILAKVI